MFSDKTILVTGGTGSFGKRFIEVIFQKYSPRKVIVFSRDELKQYEMQIDPVFSKHSPNVRYFLGDIRDTDRLQFAMRSGIDYVVHAAALKQVPALEYNPFEAVKTNVIGSQNVITSSIYGGVSKVLALSTDKAAAPVNLYGATKLTSDKLFMSANNFRGDSETAFSVVRYGNVMGSRGSVVPYFLEQRKMNVIPITDQRMTRFNITLNEGVNFVIESFQRMQGAEMFVPKLPSYNIIDLAKAICPNCKHKIVGIRPGEKLHEEMITTTDSGNTLEFSNHFVLLPRQNSGFNVNQVWESYVASGGEKCSDEFRYISSENEKFLSIDELRDLISANADST